MTNKLQEKNLPTSRTVLRGWFHTGYAPLVLSCGVVLISLTAHSLKPPQCVLSVVVFMICSTVMFTMSAIYNVFNWSPKVKSVLRRIDHANIFLIIAGTYTPIAVNALPWPAKDLPVTLSWFYSGEILLITIWTLTIISLVFNIIWITAPRVLSTMIYIVLGLFSVIYLPAIIECEVIEHPIVVVSLIASGGLLYIIGAVFYALKWPGKNAKVFGFHELFHIFTIFAFACHAVAIYFVAL